jgi:hypothetical protein
MLPFEGLRKHLDGYWHELGYDVPGANIISGAVTI